MEYVVLVEYFYYVVCGRLTPGGLRCTLMPDEESWIVYSWDKDGFLLA